MNQFLAAIAWIFDAAHYAGSNGIPVRLGEHVFDSVLTVLIAGAIALPIGAVIGHTGRGRWAAVQVSGALRALPTLGLLLLLALLVGIGLLAPLIALVILAIPPILAGAYSGLEAVERHTIDAATSLGMTGWQVFAKVELPLALPLIMGGLRASMLQVIATWTVAGILPSGSGGGLGHYLIFGLDLHDYPQMLAGSILVVGLALVVDGVFALAQRLVIPRGVGAGRAEDVRAKATQHPHR